MDLSLLKNWWWLTLNGIAALLFGLLALLYPLNTIVLLLGYFGLLALFLGTLFMLGGFLNRKGTRLWDFWFFEGVLNTSIGLILLFHNNITVAMFQVLLSLWAILIGAIQIVTVLRMWESVKNRMLYLINGIIALIFGVFIITFPFEDIARLTVFVGIYAMILGAFSIAISFSLKRLKSADSENKTPTYTYSHQ